MTLRELRMWHWGFVISNRRSARAAEYKYNGIRNDTIKARYYWRQMQKHDELANFHLKAVQALNDVVTGTAEADYMGDVDGTKSRLA